MKISRVSITNIKGVEYQEFAVGALTILEGRNGEGKSSCLDAISSIFEGGHDPGLIRIGEKKGEVLITLDDGTTIKKTVTEKTSTLDIKTKDGVKVPAPMEFVKAIACGIAFDPLSFVACDAKKRAAFLLEIMPIEFTVDEFGSLGIDRLPVVRDLDGLKALRTQLYDMRTAANRAGRDAEGTVKTLLESLPEDDGKDWSAVEQSLLSEQAEVESQIAEAQEFVRSGALAEIHTISEEIDRKIAALRAEKSERVAAVKQRETDTLQANEAVAQPERQRLTGEIATAREKSKAQTKAAGARESIELMRKKVREHFVQSETLSRQIEGLDKLRQQKIDQLPIPGITFEDGEVFVEGIPFDSLNTAEQYVRSFQIAALKEGSLMVADRAEALDPDKWEEFCSAAYQWAKESGRQVITARVTQGSLRSEQWKPKEVTA